MQILDPRPVCKWLLCFHSTQLFENALKISQCPYHLHPSFSIPLCRLCDQIFPGISLINHIFHALSNTCCFHFLNVYYIIRQSSQEISPRGITLVCTSSVIRLKTFCYVCKINAIFPVISNSLL